MNNFVGQLFQFILVKTPWDLLRVPQQPPVYKPLIPSTGLDFCEALFIEREQTHLAHLANTASLTEGADCPHVALVPGAKLRRVVVDRGIQGNAGVHVPGGLQVVALTERREKKRSSKVVGLQSWG